MSTSGSEIWDLANKKQHRFKPTIEGNFHTKRGDTWPTVVISSTWDPNTQTSWIILINLINRCIYIYIYINRTLMTIDSRLHRQTIQPVKLPPTPNRNTWHVTAPAPVGNTRTNPGGAGKLTEGLPLLTCQKPDLFKITGILESCLKIRLWLNDSLQLCYRSSESEDTCPARPDRP